MAQVTSKPRETEQKMNEDKRSKDTPGSGTAKPEVQTVRYDWPTLPATPSPDVLFNKLNQRRSGDQPQSAQTMPAIWLPSYRDSPWRYYGLTENSLVVKKFNYLATSNSNDADDAPVSQHIHEHHHYGHRYPLIPNQQKPVRHERHGHLVKVDTSGIVTAPPLPIPNHDIGIFRPHSNQRIVENGPYYHQYGPQFNCPYYAEYQNGTYPQPQVAPYPEVSAVGQHYHIHQHYYHPHYQYQSAVKYQQSQFSHHPHQTRFLAHQQPRFHAHQHTAQFPYNHTRPYFAYNEGFNWFNQGPFPRPPYVQNEYDLSALKEVLRTM